MNITVYSKDNCIWCDRAKNLLNSVNFEFDEIDLSNDEERQEFYKRGYLHPPSAITCPPKP